MHYDLFPFCSPAPYRSEGATSAERLRHFDPGAWARHLPPLPQLREDLSAGCGLRFSREVYGSKREKTVLREHVTGSFLLLLQRPPKEISGNLQEFTGKSNLGILYASSLLPAWSLRENVI